MVFGKKGLKYPCRLVKGCMSGFSILKFQYYYGIKALMHLTAQ